MSPIGHFSVVEGKTKISNFLHTFNDFHQLFTAESHIPLFAWRPFWRNSAEILLCEKWHLVTVCRHWVFYWLPIIVAELELCLSAVFYWTRVLLGSYTCLYMLGCVFLVEWVMLLMSAMVKTQSTELVTHSHTALTHQLTGSDAVSCYSDLSFLSLGFSFSFSSSQTASGSDSQIHFFVAKQLHW